MTTVRIWKNRDNIITAFELYGHAKYARLGKDIVCAAISILATNTINSIEELTEDKTNVASDEKSGMIRCVFNNTPSDKSILLVDSMIIGLKQIQKEYGNKFIEIIFEEVSHA